VRSCASCTTSAPALGSPGAASSRATTTSIRATRSTVATATCCARSHSSTGIWLATGGEDRHLAHPCWTFIGINPAADPGLIRHRVRVCLDAQEWAGTDDEVVSATLWWQDRCHRGIRAEADAGDPAMQALVSNGVMDDVRDDYDWTLENLSHAETPEDGHHGRADTRRKDAPAAWRPSHTSDV